MKTKLFFAIFPVSFMLAILLCSSSTGVAASASGTTHQLEGPALFYTADASDRKSNDHSNAKTENGPALFGTENLSESNESDPAPAHIAQPDLTEEDSEAGGPVKMNPSKPDEPVINSQEPEQTEEATSQPADSNSTELDQADQNEVSEDKAQPEIAEDNTPSKPKKPVVVKPKRILSPAMTSLRDQVRHMLALYQKAPLNTQQNTANEIMDYCLPFGCSTEILLFNKNGKQNVNGVTCLCWNYPCKGFAPLYLNNGHIAARIGYGMQSQPSQLLAMLAFARVQSSYPMRVRDNVQTVADLVESEKLSCNTDADLSLKLIGLTYYLEDETWKNDLGETWSVEKIVKQELDRPVLSATNGGLDRLLGLSYAVYRREKRGLPINGQFERAKKYVHDFHKFAFSVQNPDGSWGYYLSNRGSNQNTSAQLRSSGYVFEWLALSMPEDQLDSPQMAAAAAYLYSALNNRTYLTQLPVLSTHDISAITHALHGLAIYDQRLFKPADPDPTEEKPTEENPPATAQKASK